MSLRSHIATGAKTLSWRATAAVDTFCVVVLLGGNGWRVAVSIVAAEFATKAIWFYAHERAWTLPFLSNLSKESR